MELSELNKLLKPYGITLECDNCEAFTLEPANPKPQPPNTTSISKKIKKRSTKVPVEKFVEEKKSNVTRKYQTAKKPSRTFANFFDDDIKTWSTPTHKNSIAFAPKNVDFFFEFKQSCDNFLNCPQFDNINNCDEIKTRDFDMDTAVSSLELSDGNSSVNYDDLHALKKNLFNQNENTNALMTKMPEGTLDFTFESYDDFELDFGQHSRFSEFFSFA